MADPGVMLPSSTRTCTRSSAHMSNSRLCSARLAPSDWQLRQLCLPEARFSQSPVALCKRCAREQGQRGLFCALLALST